MQKQHIFISSKPFLFLQFSRNKSSDFFPPNFLFQNEPLIKLPQSWLSLGNAKWKDGDMILNWSCLDLTQTQLSPSYLHFCHKLCSLFWKQMLPSLLVRRMIWYTALHYKTIFSHCIALAVWEDFVPLQCHNYLIFSHLSGEIYSLSLCIKAHSKSLDMTHFLHSNAYSHFRIIPQCAFW